MKQFGRVRVCAAVLPQVEPGNVMPEMGVTPNDARDIATYHYTLR